MAIAESSDTSLTATQLAGRGASTLIALADVELLHVPIGETDSKRHISQFVPLSRQSVRN